MKSLITSIEKENGTYHPRNENDVLALIQYALDQKLTLRCKASGHAWPPGIASGRATFEKGFKEDPNAVYQVPTSKTGQLNIKLDCMDNNQAVQLTRDEADRIGLDWDYVWKDLNGPGKDVSVKGKLFKIGGGLVLGSNENDGGSVSIKEGALYNLDSNECALFDLGGIYSQTVAGYLSTGAAGGSTKDSIEENIVAYKIATYENGTAKTRIIRKSGGAGKAASADDEFETFQAYSTSMGLLGVTLEVYVRGIPRFAIAGYEVTTNLRDCEVDLFGNGFDDEGKRKQYAFTYTDKEDKHITMKGHQLSMKEYLKKYKYTRLEWWPQKGVNRVVLWKAAKIDIPKDSMEYPQQKLKSSNAQVSVPSSVSFKGATPELNYPTPYQNAFLGTRKPGFFNGGTGDGQVTVLEVLSSLLLTIIGNLNNLANVELKWSIDAQFDKWFEEFEKQALNIVRTAGVPEDSAKIVAEKLIRIVKAIVNKGLVSPLIVDLGQFLLKIEPVVLRFLYNIFAAPLSDGGPQQFTDIWFEGLPMDKDVNYAIIPVVFTELWFPINRSLEVMEIVQQVFTSDNIETLFAIEFYAGAKSNSWLSASGPWPDSVDENSPVLRVDVYYFPYNNEPGVNPTDLVSNGKEFYSKIWTDITKRCAAKDKPVPFKFHLGKYSGDIARTEQYKMQYKKWDDWHKKRKEMDPLSIFMNDYWSEKLDIDHDNDNDGQSRKCCLNKWIC